MKYKKEKTTHLLYLQKNNTVNNCLFFTEPPTFNGYLKSDIQSFLDRNRGDLNTDQNRSHSNDGDNKCSDNDDTIVDDDEDNNSLTLESYPGK